jgi:uncharacterized protein YfdQ (DUF2303 family)
MNNGSINNILESSQIADVVKIAQDALAPSQVSVTPDNIMFVPGNSLTPSKFVDLDTIRQPATPRRKTGTVNVFSVDSFNAFIMQNKDAGNITVYADSNTEHPAIIAVLNDNGIAGPGHRDFRCSIQFRETVEWRKWKSIDGKMIDQANFAEFIEENIADIHDPAGAAMLEIVTYLQATRSVDFKSALNLSNGNVQFQNTESLDAKVGTGQINIPTEFTLGIAPIQGARAFEIPARFRYRLSEGKLKLGLKLLRAEDVMAQIFNETLSEVIQGDGVVLIWGTP